MIKCVSVQGKFTLVAVADNNVVSWQFLQHVFQNHEPVDQQR